MLLTMAAEIINHIVRAVLKKFTADSLLIIYILNAKSSRHKNCAQCMLIEYHLSLT